MQTNRILFLTAGLALGALVLFHGQARALPAQGPLTKDQQKCGAALAKNLQKIQSALVKDHLKCIKDGSKNKLVDQTIEECVASDPKGKVLKSTEKLNADWLKRCVGAGKSGGIKEPGWGPADPNSALLAIDLAGELFTDLLGDDLDAAILDPKDLGIPNAKETSKCQQTVLKDAAKCFLTRNKEFGSCYKSGTKGGKISVPGALDPMGSNQDLDLCLDFDPKGKVLKVCTTKLEADIAKKCASPVDLDAAFPGLAGPALPDLPASVRAAVDARYAKTHIISAALGAGCAADPNLPVIDNLVCQPDTTRYCSTDFSACTAAADCPVLQDANGNDIPRHCRAVSDFEVRINNFSAPDEIVFSNNIVWDAPINFSCGAPDPNGVASCTCELDGVVSYEILGGSAGYACIRSFPGCEGCGGEIACSPGATRGDLVMTSEHSIGFCLNPASCEASCTTYCSGLGAEVLEARCEGFCRHGEDDGDVCVDLTDCLGSSPPATSGQCGGAVSGGINIHQNTCQCACLERQGSGTTPEATLSCVMGLRIDIEASLPCDQAPSDILDTKIIKLPLTTNLSDSTLLDAGLTGLTIHPVPLIGSRLSCCALQQGLMNGLTMVGAFNAQDVLGFSIDSLDPGGFTCR